MTTKKVQANNHMKQIAQLALIVSVIQPLMTLPQIYQVFSTQSAQDVSLFTWLGYTILGSVLLVYGIVYRLKPIIFGQAIWTTLEIVMVIGILLYG
jgi:uncharacterized protein with PQ loop repeat